VLDLTGIPALDLAIGLAFIFFLLSTLVTTLQEFIAAFFGLRARTLEQGLRSLLEDPKKGWAFVDKFYEHSLIQSLYRTPPPAVMKPKPTEKAAAKATKKAAKNVAKNEAKDVKLAHGKNADLAKQAWYERALGFFKRTKGPSYISPRAFALVVLHNIAPEKDKETIFDQANKVLDDLPPGNIPEHVKPLIASAQKDVDSLRTHLEAWYDDGMARVSGWYKRKTQIIILVLGVVLVPALNANTITMAQRMWKDDTVRSAIVAQSSNRPAKDLNAAADAVDQAHNIGIPLGWRGAAVPKGSVGGIAQAALGWLVTILAISLGAPFWFDTLSRLSRLRSSGKPETPLPAAGSGKSNERVRTAPQNAMQGLELTVTRRPSP
jgi:hypothetical protein